MRRNTQARSSATRSSDRRSAQRFLDALLDDRSPDFEPPTTASWAEEFLSAFRRFREKQRGKEAQLAAMRLGRGAAADPYRFFWELWQNADDAAATDLTFEVADDRLTVGNNGRPFSPVDVFSLLMVGETAKEGQDDQIGQFGVGSLALMRFSDSPTYWSGHYAFTLQRTYTYPGPASITGENHLDGLRIVAPLNDSENPDNLYAALEGLIDGETLLYMKHLQRVTLTRAGAEIRTTEAYVPRSGAGGLVTIGGRTRFRYERDVFPPPDMRRDDGTDVSDPVRVTLTREASGIAPVSLVYAFFPTQVRHHYPWSFSAPFDVTTGREGLIESQFNRWLLRQIGRLMVQAAIDASVGNPSAPWGLVPRAPDESDLLSEVWRGALEEMQSIAWLPAGSRLIRARDAAFPETADIRPLVRTADLAKVAGKPKRWVDGVPPSEVRPVLEAAGAYRVCCHTLSAVLAEGPTGRGPSWYLRALATTIKVAEERGDDTVDARLIAGHCLLDRRGQPFSLREAVSAGQVVCNTRSEVLSQRLGHLFIDDLVVLLHKVYRRPDRRTEEQDDLFGQQIDQWLRATASKSAFQYENRLDAPAFIRHFIVDRKLAVSGGEVADHLLTFVRDHLEAYVSDQGPHRRLRTLAELGRVLTVKAHRWTPSGKRETAYLPISDVYLPARFAERAAWPEAARGVPGLWWANSSYRSQLVRKDNPLGVARFLRDLGAAIGPRTKPIESTAGHGSHRFYRVAHNDHARFPNFPHDSARFTEFSDYGLVDEVDSADLQAWWSYVSGLPDHDKAQRGEALHRMFEEQWDSVYKGISVARARGFRANAAYPLGEVPARWLWRLRTSAWVALEGGGFATPTTTFARSPTVLALLRPNEDPVCAWEVRASGDVTRALGYRVDVPSSLVLKYLRDACAHRAHVPMPTARAYYEHLAKQASTTPELVTAFDEGLIFSPSERHEWWRPSDCLRGDQRSHFGGMCGYVDSYPAAEALWIRLGIRDAADLQFLAAFWHRIARELGPADPELRKLLPPSYRLAERLAGADSPNPTTVPVLANDEWHPSSEVFATNSEELATHLARDGLWRWDGDASDLLPHFLRWIGMLNVDRTSRFQLLPGDIQFEPALEKQVHRGVKALAADLHANQPELWNALKVRLREIIRGRVQIVDPLRQCVAVSHAQLGERKYEVATPAFYQGGNVFLSRLTKPSDRAVAIILLAGVPLAGGARWAAINALQLYLSQELAGMQSVPTDFPDEDFSQPEQDEEPAEEMAEDVPADRRKDSQTRRSSTRPALPPPPPPYPVDQYEVESDEGGDEPITAYGGLEPRRTGNLRRPSGGGGGGSVAADRHPRQSTEQRAVELYRLHVLEPAGIEVNDQRLRPRVGADLVGDDGVFRELKAHSGAAPNEVSLTEHEYQRASNSGKKYELVIVEHVWDEPVITVIPEPLSRLKYAPMGGVLVHGWRGNTVKPRIVHLRMR